MHGSALSNSLAQQALFTCSIDDGHPSDARLGTLLDRHGLQATFYVPITNCEMRPVLSCSVLRELDARFEIGSHTLDHHYLHQLDHETCRRQILGGKTALEDLLGHTVPGFCYPGGRFGATQQEAVRRAGFRYARSTMNLRFDAGHERFAMPTTIQFYPHSTDVYLRNLLRGGAWHARSSALLLALRHQQWQQRIHALFAHACRHGLLFHLWCHSWEIDQLDAWQSLDHFFTMVRQQLAPHQCISNGELAKRTYALPADGRPNGEPVK